MTLPDLPAPTQSLVELLLSWIRLHLHLWAMVEASLSTLPCKNHFVFRGVGHSYSLVRGTFSVFTPNNDDIKKNNIYSRHRDVFLMESYSVREQQLSLQSLQPYCGTSLKSWHRVLPRLRVNKIDLLFTKSLIGFYGFKLLTI